METTIEGADGASADVCLAAEPPPFPPMIMRQILRRPKWFRRLVVGAYRRHAELAMLGAEGEIPAFVKRPDEALVEALRPWGALEAKTHAFPVSPEAPGFDLIAGLFDMASTFGSNGVLPVVAFAKQAPRGLIVRLPLVVAS